MVREFTASESVCVSHPGNGGPTAVPSGGRAVQLGSQEGGKKGQDRPGRGTLLARWEERGTLDLGVVRSLPTLCVDITKEIMNEQALKNKKQTKQTDQGTLLRLGRRSGRSWTPGSACLNQSVDTRRNGKEGCGGHLRA